MAGIHARGWHGLVAAGTALVVAGVTMVGASAAPPPKGPGPMFKSGDNGFSAPSNGAAKMVDEGLGGQGGLLTSVSGGPNQAGYGLVSVPGGPATAKTFGDLTDVETQFNLTQGTCSGGAPRWIIDLTDPSNPKNTQFLQVYFDNSHQPFGGCNPGTQQETNIINSPTTGWFVGNSNTPETYTQVKATYGSWKLNDVQVVVDAGWAQGSQLNPNIQQVLLQKLKVNNATYFPLPGS